MISNYYVFVLMKCKILTSIDTTSPYIFLSQQHLQDLNYSLHDYHSGNETGEVDTGVCILGHSIIRKLTFDSMYQNNSMQKSCVIIADF